VHSFDILKSVCPVPLQSQAARRSLPAVVTPGVSDSYRLGALLERVHRRLPYLAVHCHVLQEVRVDSQGPYSQAQEAASSCVSLSTTSTVNFDFCNLPFVLCLRVGTA
jgi:hypothetical protein